MAATVLSRTYGDVLSMTVDAVYDQGGIADEIFNGLPLFRAMKERVKTKSGGSKIRVPVMYAKNATAKSYRDLDPLDTTRQSTHTTAWYDWKQIACTISISGFEMRTNSGPEEIYDLYQERYDNAVLSLQDAINTMLWSDGTGNSSKDLLGLRAIVSSTPTTGTLASINRANETWWRNKQRTGGSFASQGIADLRALWVACSNNVPKGQPTVHFTTSTVYNSYEAILEPREQFTKDYASGKTGFKAGDAGFMPGALTFKGAPVIWDDAAVSGNWYMLNTNFLQMIMHKDASFRPTDRIPMHDQDAWVVHILFMGELVCNAPRFQGVLTAITA
jgi:hypothetical protein